MVKPDSIEKNRIIEVGDHRSVISVNKILDRNSGTSQVKCRKRDFKTWEIQ